MSTILNLISICIHIDKIIHLTLLYTPHSEYTSKDPPDHDGQGVCNGFSADDLNLNTDGSHPSPVCEHNRPFVEISMCIMHIAHQDVFQIYTCVTIISS